jgi:hypothetical protein
VCRLPKDGKDAISIVLNRRTDDLAGGCIKLCAMIAVRFGNVMSEVELNILYIPEASGSYSSPILLSGNYGNTMWL